MGIEKQFWGQKLKDIPVKEFGFCEFDDYRPGPSDQWFGLVLAATQKVPGGPSNDWHLGSMQTCGFHYDQDKAAFLPLDIRPEALVLVEQIADEDFARKKGLFPGATRMGDQSPLDEYRMAQIPSLDDRDPVLQAYISFLAENGLCWTTRKPDGVTLKQALYPIDATQGILERLSSTVVDLRGVDPDESCGLVIWVVGVNCD